ncbi:MAG: enoyl-CoA hydratase/isomerase family protein [Deltaproteobacteria bacterium]|nr:enoyl-CoA hydratase/isomerase family protein [Deltaproteobacteria bacterium]MBW2363189.1 enoyl-CoA hydratase/isomerase family protein [Deltaproteobacteria bacterium]
MQSELIHIEIGGGVAIATIDNPPMNLLGSELLVALDTLGREVEANDAVRVLVMRSANPDFFIAHGDVEAMVGVPETPAAAEPPDELPWIHACMDRFRTMPKVTIAQIEGYARGGGSEVALACDMRFAVRGRAVFGQPEVGMGLLPGVGGTVRLMRLVGRARASEIIFGGDDFTAVEAERLGWVNRALSPDEIGPHVDRLARRIAGFPARAIAEIKRVMNYAERETLPQLRHEQHRFDHLMADSDSRRLMRRWLDLGFQTPEGEQSIGMQLPKMGSGEAT